ncbi:MAG: hypothetical protein WD850_00525 [Candidatus Spechtbacterales bacterium]
MENKTFIIIVIVALVGVGGWYLLHQSFKEPTRVAGNTDWEVYHWNVYRSETYGFEFEFPSAYTFAEQDAERDFYIKLATLTRGENVVSMQVIDNIDVYAKASPRQVLERELHHSPCEYTIESSTINGYAAAEAAFSNVEEILLGVCFGEESVEEILLVRDPAQNRFIQFSFKGEHIDKDRIHSTFRFTE